MSGFGCEWPLAQGDPQRAFDPATAAVRKPGTTVRIDLIGDSTQTDHAGYGRGFCANFTAAVDCVNMARGGASTRTFREQGLWERSLQTKPDYMVIQFGHNDMVNPAQPMPRQVPLPEYEANLRQYIDRGAGGGHQADSVHAAGAADFFRTDGKVHSNLNEYAAAMKKVAAEMKVPLIDLHEESIAYLDKVGIGGEPHAFDHEEGCRTARRSLMRRIWTGRDRMSLGGWWRWVWARPRRSWRSMCGRRRRSYLPEGVKAMAVI